MINVPSIRTAARACPGDVVGLNKAQLDELLGEVEAGQQARRALEKLAATAPSVGITGVSVAA